MRSAEPGDYGHALRANDRLAEGVSVGLRGTPREPARAVGVPERLMPSGDELLQKEVEKPEGRTKAVELVRSNFAGFAPEIPSG
jgi:hypothetical protein